MRRSLTILVPTVLMLLGATPAHAKCGGGDHQQIMERVGDVRLYRVNSNTETGADDRVYVCSSRHGKAVRLGDYRNNDYRRLTVNGDFVAFVRTYLSIGDAGDSDMVEVVNLRSGRWSADARDIDSTVPKLRSCDYYGVGESCYFFNNGLLRLTPSGSVAFTATVFGDDDSPTIFGVYRYEFNAGLTRQWTEVVGHVRKREMKTLFVKNNLMHWRGYGKLRSAYIR